MCPQLRFRRGDGGGAHRAAACEEQLPARETGIDTKGVHTIDGTPAR